MKVIPVSYKQPIAQDGNVWRSLNELLEVRFEFHFKSSTMVFNRLIMARTAQKKDFGAGSQTDLTR